MAKIYLTAACVLLCWDSAAWAAKTVTINKQQITVDKPAAKASEAALHMKKVFLFPSVDDISGVLAPKLDEKLVQVFRSNTRFDLIRDPAVVRALSPDENAYAKVAQDQTVHREAAKVTRADTTVLLRTRNVGTNTEMTLEFRDADGEPLYMESGSVPGYSSMEARWGLIEKLFNTVVKKIPFEGTVTGRTANTITIDLGFRSLKQGEDLEIARIVSVQRHPLLRTIVGVDYVRVGRARVTTVDKVLSFAEVVEEFPGEFVASGNKVLAARKQSVLSEPAETEAPEKTKEKPEARKDDQPKFEDEKLLGDFDRPKARYGHVGLNINYGSLSHSQTSGGTNSEISGSGLGVNLDGELWVTRHWIAKLYYGMQSASMTGTGVTAPLSSTWKRIEFFGGYRFFPNGDQGLAITGALGYQVMDFDIPLSGTIGGRRFVGPALKAEVSLQFQERQKLMTSLSFQPFSSVTEKAASLGTPDSGNVVSFDLGWGYALADNIWAKLGIQFDSASSSYPAGATTSEKRFAIGPGIQYSF